MEVNFVKNANQITNIEHQVAVKIPNERNKGVIDVLLTVDNYKVIFGREKF